MLPALLLAMVAALPAQGQTGGQTITIGTAVPIPGVLEHDGAGNVSGLEGDLLAAICDRAGWTCTWEVMAFDTLFPALEVGRIDIAANMLGLTPERAARLPMSCPYWPDTGAFYGGEFLVTDPAHTPMDGTVAVVRDSLFADNLDARGIPLRLFSDQDAAIGALLAGEVQAYFGDGRAVSAHPSRAQLINAGVLPNVSRGIALAITPTRPGFIAEVDGHLAGLSQDGALSDLLNRWASIDIEDPILVCDTAGPVS